MDCNRTPLFVDYATITADRYVRVSLTCRLSSLALVFLSFVIRRTPGHPTRLPRLTRLVSSCVRARRSTQEPVFRHLCTTRFVALRQQRLGERAAAAPFRHHHQPRVDFVCHRADRIADARVGVGAAATSQRIVPPGTRFSNTAARARGLTPREGSRYRPTSSPLRRRDAHRPRTRSGWRRKRPRRARSRGPRRARRRPRAIAWGDHVEQQERVPGPVHVRALRSRATSQDTSELTSSRGTNTTRSGEARASSRKHCGSGAATGRTCRLEARASGSEEALGRSERASSLLKTKRIIHRPPQMMCRFSLSTPRDDRGHSTGALMALHAVGVDR